MPGRNTGAHFSEAPQSYIRKSKMPIKYTHKTTFNTGDLIPVFVQEVLPGDTYKIEMDSLTRLSTPKFPTMDNMYQDSYFFFVPYRLIWDNWQKFMGENNDAWAQDTSQFIPPHIKLGGTGTTHIQTIDSGSILNYLCLPQIQGPATIKEVDTTIFDLNAYIKVFNDWFRDQNLQDEVPMYKGDGELPTSYRTAYANWIYNNTGTLVTDINGTNTCLKVAKFHDYFTSALPAPQKGPDVLIPAGGDVELADTLSNTNAPYFVKSTGTIYQGDVTNVGTNPTYIHIAQDSSTDRMFMDPNGSLVLNGLEITVNNLRLAMQTQKLLERDARGGTRYTELLYSHFGVISPDGRLQRSEYLGGKRTIINMTEVVQTSESGTTPQGNLAGRSATATHEDGFVKSFTEHGLIIGLVCIRTQRTYCQGIPKRYSRFERLQHYFPVLANIGEQPILNKEIYLPRNTDSENPDDVFGYQEAWAEYRYTPDRVSGKFDPGASQSLAPWHYGDYYQNTPTLSSQWLVQGTSEVARTLVYTNTNQVNQFYSDFYIHGNMTRPMPIYSIPGLVDHN